MPQFYAIEGLSGSGKSTIYHKLQERSRFVGIPCIPDEYLNGRRWFQDIQHLEARFLYFVSALAYTAVTIKAELEQGHHVVVESYIFRTISFHRALGATTDLISLALPKPDRVFFLHCDEDVRQARRLARGRKRDIWDKLGEAATPQILEHYAHWDMTRLDTSHREPDAVAGIIMSARLNVP